METKFKKNERYELTINESIGKNGEGVGRIGGFAFFVDGALPGEQVEFVATKIKSCYGYGRLTRVITPSLERAEPPCPMFKACGGCTLQHMSYEAQKRAKTKIVADCLKKIAGLDDIEVSPIIGMDEPYFYRNKAQYPAGLVDGNPTLGFYSARSHRLVDISQCCVVQNRANAGILEVITGVMREKNIEIYDEAEHCGLLRHVMIRNGQNGSAMVVFVVNGKKLPHAELFVERLSKIPEVKSVWLNINTAKTNVILGGGMVHLYGEQRLTETIGELSFTISPQSFFQTNTAQTRALYKVIEDFAGLTGVETVYDSYCGTGTIALTLAAKARQVTGIEIVEPAVRDARENSANNGISNAAFILGDAAEVLARELSGNAPDVVILDPPRKGCDVKALNALLKAVPEKIIYVSCDPATLARDIAMLSSAYNAQKIQPVDMFPHTTHVECVVKLCGKDRL